MKKHIRYIIVLFTSGALTSCFGPFNPEDPTMGLKNHTPNPTTTSETLVAWWKCNDSGSEVLKNSAKYAGNQGNLPSNMEFGKGFDSTGNALKFGNASRRITVNDDSTLDFGYSDFTISLWCIPKNSESDTGALISKGIKDTSTTYTISVINNYLVVMLGSRKYRVLEGDDTLSSIIWNHIALVRESNALMFYINGKKYSPESFSTHSLSNNSTLYIGMDSRQDHLYKGYLDEIKIERSAWDAFDITQEYNRKK